jgi:hypothetical protein
MGKIHPYAEGIEKPVIRAIEETGPARTVCARHPRSKPWGVDAGVLQEQQCASSMAKPEDTNSEIEN